VSIFIDKVILPLGVAIVAALLLFNPFHFDWKQRISLSIAILFSSYFLAHTLDLRDESARSLIVPPPNAAQQKSPNAPASPKVKNKVAGGEKSSIRIEQRSEGPNSPNVVTTGPHSPVTINPPVNPNAPVVTFDFNGAKRIQTPGRSEAVAGDQYAKFQEMVALEKAKKWDALARLADSQISIVPDWLTPYLLKAEAEGNLGNRAKAVELCNFVKDRSGGNQAFDQPADRLLKLFK
jgi:hypothetical protein